MVREVNLGSILFIRRIRLVSCEGQSNNDNFIITVHNICHTFLGGKDMHLFDELSIEIRNQSV